MKRKIALWVSDICGMSQDSVDKGWFAVRDFAAEFWPLLSQFTMVVSKRTETILAKVAARATGVDVVWDLEVLDSNPRVFTDKLVEAAGRGEVERILIFLDPKRLEIERGHIDMLTQAAAEDNLLVHVNWSNALWAKSESTGVQGSRKAPGPHDTVMCIGSSEAIKRFSQDHLPTLMRFPHIILSRNILISITAELPRDRHPGLVVGLPDGDFSSPGLVAKDFVNAGQGAHADLSAKFCHIVLCTNPQLQLEPDLENFLSVCSNPRLRTNLILSARSAAEWISAFELPEPALSA